MLDGHKRITVIVGTRNRAYYLKKALLSFVDQTLSTELYEIIVVDNVSTDNTKEVVETIAKNAKVDIRYIVEERIGSHYTRNRGVLNAQGNIIVVGDDDIIACREWLACILQEFDNNPTTGIVGGKIKAIWSRQPDEWVFDYGTEKVHTVFAYLDYGDERKVLRYEHVFGCNFAVRKELIVKAGGWHPDIYPEHLLHLSGDGECSVTDKIREFNYSVVYLPQAFVWHHVDAGRLTFDYFMYRHERWAVEWVFTEFRNNSKEQAARNLGNLAMSFCDRAYREYQNKHNPNNFYIIWKKTSMAIIEQTMRVLFDDLLYDHIMQTSYL